jgi:hypothetical protein
VRSVLSGAKALLIVAAVAAGLAGGVAAARFAHPLGFLSFHINGTGVNMTWVPVYLDLGTLNEGQAVNATGTGEITIPRTGHYLLYIVASEKFGRVFQYFNVTVTIDGEKTYELSLYKPVVKVELSEGDHTIQVTLNAKVGTHLPSITVKHAPLLAICSPEAHHARAPHPPHHEAPHTGSHGGLHG